MTIEALTETLKIAGLVLLGIGGVFELLGAIGILRFPYFYLRAHAATMTVVGGTVTPLIGISLVSIAEMGLDGLYFAAICTITAVLILITAPTGSHLLVKASYYMEYKVRNQSIKVEDEISDNG